MAALMHPKTVNEMLTRFILECLADWGHNQVIVRCQQETAELALQEAVIRHRPQSTIPQQAKKYSHGSLGGAERAIMELNKQIRTMLL